MTLKENAILNYKDLASNPVLTEEQKINQAGWYAGEWTCCKCGCMIGKNLKSEVPYFLARQHAKKCAEK
jgi:transcription initiation factor TFIIIB Brf1 subunit/transcription initiation factor TFIIB